MQTGYTIEGAADLLTSLRSMKSGAAANFSDRTVKIDHLKKAVQILFVSKQHRNNEVREIDL
jgi:hypothetical protein